MQFDWSEGALAAGLACYRNGEFFEAHEHWETVWLACADPEKTFLQALIQVSAAFHHWRGGNAVGTASLLRNALLKLNACSGEFCGIAVDPLKESIRAWLSALDSGDTAPKLPIPTIR